MAGWLMLQYGEKRSMKMAGSLAIIWLARLARHLSNTSWPQAMWRG